MNAAARPVQRPADARLLVVDGRGGLRHAARERLADLFAPGDLVVANDAATLPASLAGRHLRTGAAIEVRLAGRSRGVPAEAAAFDAVVFGAGDHRTPTERRPAPPAFDVGDALVLGPLVARVGRLLGHARLAALRFDGGADAFWAGLVQHGRPIQYAHMPDALALWDVWTCIAARPVAFEPPSAGFLLDWRLLHRLRERGVGFATLTHAAGISSTGDAGLDARLPFDEPYDLPAATIAAIERTRRAGGRVIALGTTVVRALEHAAAAGPLRPGPALADQRLGARSTLRLVDVLVSGTHEPGSSHHALLHAFASAALLRQVDAALERHGYRTHEFGDSVMIEAASVAGRRIVS